MHFTCIVFNTDKDDVYSLMEKFRENNFGDVEEQYLKWYGSGTCDYYDTKEEAIADGNEEDDIFRTNPNSQFDWAVEGGRWGEFFYSKSGVKKNRIKIKNLDIARPIELMKRKMGEMWDSVDKVIDGDWNFKTMSEIEADTFEQRLAIYFSQPQAKKIEKGLSDKDYEISYYLKDMKKGRDGFIQQFVNDVYRPYAYLLNDEWCETETNEWNPDGKYKTFADFLLSFPPETQITLMDCHI